MAMAEPPQRLRLIGEEAFEFPSARGPGPARAETTSPQSSVEVFPVSADSDSAFLEISMPRRSTSTGDLVLDSLLSAPELDGVFLDQEKAIQAFGSAASVEAALYPSASHPPHPFLTFAPAPPLSAEGGQKLKLIEVFPTPLPPPAPTSPSQQLLAAPSSAPNPSSQTSSESGGAHHSVDGVAQPQTKRKRSSAGPRSCTFCIKRKLRCVPAREDAGGYGKICSSCADRGLPCSFVSPEEALKVLATPSTDATKGKRRAKPHRSFTDSRRSQQIDAAAATVIAPRNTSQTPGLAPSQTPAVSVGRLLTDYDDLPPLPPEEVRNVLFLASFRAMQTSVAIFHIHTLMREPPPPFLSLAMEALGGHYMRMYQQAELCYQRARRDVVRLLASIDDNATVAWSQGTESVPGTKLVTVIQAFVVLLAYSFSACKISPDSPEFRWLAMAVAAARQLNLFREDWRIHDPIARESRRRLWWYLFMIDAKGSAMSDTESMFPEEESANLLMMGSEPAWCLNLPLKAEDTVYFHEILTALDAPPIPLHNVAGRHQTDFLSLAPSTPPKSSSAVPLHPTIPTNGIPTPHSSLSFFWSREVAAVLLLRRGATVSRRLWPCPFNIPSPAATKIGTCPFIPSASLPPAPMPDFHHPLLGRYAAAVDTWLASFQAYHEIGTLSASSPGPNRAGEFSQLWCREGAIIAFSPKWAIEFLFSDPPLTPPGSRLPPGSDGTLPPHPLSPQFDPVLLAWAASPHAAVCRQHLAAMVEFWSEALRYHKQLDEQGFEFPSEEAFSVAAAAAPFAPFPADTTGSGPSSSPRIDTHWGGTSAPLIDRHFKALGFLQWDLLLLAKYVTVLEVAGRFGAGRWEIGARWFGVLERCAEKMALYSQGLDMAWSELMSVRRSLLEGVLRGSGKEV
ncbi:hypothetical protein HDU96_002979 [Phlyctochytrium bullatum]|nr:hypothetical protein HDU96_002979 [Phlyctochytrium bullatum]